MKKILIRKTNFYLASNTIKLTNCTCKENHRLIFYVCFKLNNNHFLQQLYLIKDYMIGPKDKEIKLLEI